MLQNNNIQEKVLEKIREGTVRMRSHAYFTRRAVLLIATALLLFAGSFFLLSFIFFSIHENGTGYLLHFNAQELFTFVMLFPWLTLVVVLALFIVLEALVRHFTFGYRSSLLRVFLWILAVGAVGSTLLGLTPLHFLLLSSADNDQLPFLGAWYEHVHDSHQVQGIYRGDITSIIDSSFVISHNDTDRDSDEGTWSIVPPDTFDVSTLAIGQKVYVAGRLRDGVVYAYGIHAIANDE